MVNDSIKIIGIGRKLKFLFNTGGNSYGILSKHLPPQFQIQKITSQLSCQFNLAFYKQLL